MKVRRKLTFCDFKNKQIRDAIYHAKNTALQSPIRYARHCAIVLDENFNKVSVFYNIYNDENYPRTTHAEQGAIDRIPKHIDRSKCTLIVVRNNFIDQEQMSRPCPECQQYIKRHGIRHCVFSNCPDTFTTMVF